MKKLMLAISHLESVCNHADEDCPTEFRSKHYNTSIRDARSFIDKVLKEE